jgi:demethylmenaquinone methyltransferase / 2-methoxy-6-polyprenyl-1,4-benzoquinol methylase
MSNTDDEKTAHFGFHEVPAAEKARLVANVFRSVAEKYDLMNDLMSFGLHRVWKRVAVAEASVRTGDDVLDVAGGTGDLAALFTQRVGARGRVVIADINASMLTVGRRRLVDRGIVGNVHFVQADAEALPFADEHFHCISIGFGLRNVTRIDRALRCMWRILKPGGRLLVLEFSRPTTVSVGRLYDTYSFNVLPLLGRVVANDAASYRYLAESIRRHPDQEMLKAMMEAAGFEHVSYFNLCAGIVALHKGFKL